MKKLNRINLMFPWASWINWFLSL